MQQLRRPIVFAGPSGVGKSTLIKKLQSDFPSVFGFSISHTTRTKRPGEENHVHYHFVDRETFNKLKEDGAFIETATFASNLYGTSVQAVQAVVNMGKICILDIDIQGVLAVKEASLTPKPHFLFVVPPSIEELERRLRNRGDTSDEAIVERLTTASKELEYKDRENFWDKVLINEDLDETYATLKKWIMESYTL